MEQTVQNEKTGKLLEVKDLRVSFFTPAGERSEEHTSELQSPQ